MQTQNLSYEGYNKYLKFLGTSKIQNLNKIRGAPVLRNKRKVRIMMFLYISSAPSPPRLYCLLLFSSPLSLVFHAPSPLNFLCIHAIRSRAVKNMKRLFHSLRASRHKFVLNNATCNPLDLPDASQPFLQPLLTRNGKTR
jgi:hypothetical protein